MQEGCSTKGLTEVVKESGRKLVFTFSNSGVVQTYTRNPGLLAGLSANLDKYPPTFSSSKIVQTFDAGFELITGDQSEPASWMNHLKDDLDMPDQALLRHLTVDCSAFGVRWQHYDVRMLGIRIEQPEQAEYSWPYWLISEVNGTKIELVQVWYQRISSLTSPVMCDVRWHPQHGETANLIGVENARNGRDINRAWRGHTLLQKIKLQGRPFDTMSLTRDQFLERAPLACKKLYDMSGEKPTDVQIAEELNISRATLYRYMVNYNLSLNQIRYMAMNIMVGTQAPF
jgi:hypothetical protein